MNATISPQESGLLVLIPDRRRAKCEPLHTPRKYLVVMISATCRPARKARSNGTPKSRLNGAVALTGCCHVATPPRRPPQSGNPLYSLKYQLRPFCMCPLMHTTGTFRYFWPC
jgi:hypothetical protein